LNIVLYLSQISDYFYESFLFPTFPTRAIQNDVACAANKAVLKPFF